ncbi:MAG TPA: BON domain-containing protein [Burkholderiales bacterium]
MRASGDIEKDVRVALEHDPRLNPQRSAIDVEMQSGAVRLAGEVESIEEKRAAVEVAKGIDGVERIDDRLRVRPASALADDTLCDAVCRHLFEEPSFQGMTIHCAACGRDVLERTPHAPEGRIAVTVDGGVITLSGEVVSRAHKRLAAVLAWWTPGCRNVINALAVRPAGRDTDDEIRDAVELVLNKDPIVHSGRIDAEVRDGRVTLRGTVATREEKRLAERDVWYIEGVRDVANALEVYEGPLDTEVTRATPSGSG